MLGRMRGGLDAARRDRARRCVRARPDEEGLGVLQGQPAEGRARRGARGATSSSTCSTSRPSGLDPLMSEVFRTAVARARDAGRTVLLSSHMLAEVDAVCDRISIMRAGRDRRDRARSRICATCSGMSIVAVTEPRAARPRGRPRPARRRRTTARTLRCTVEPERLAELLTHLTAAGDRDASRAGRRRSRRCSSGTTTRPGHEHRRRSRRVRAADDAGARVAFAARARCCASRCAATACASPRGSSARGYLTTASVARRGTASTRPTESREQLAASLDRRPDAVVDPRPALRPDVAPAASRPGAPALGAAIALGSSCCFLVVRHSRADEAQGRARAARRRPARAARAAHRRAARSLVVLRPRFGVADRRGAHGARAPAWPARSPSASAGPRPALVFAASPASTAQLARDVARAPTGSRARRRRSRSSSRAVGNAPSRRQPAAVADAVRLEPADARLRRRALVAPRPARWSSPSASRASHCTCASRRDLGDGLLAQRRGRAHAASWIAGPVGASPGGSTAATCSAWAIGFARPRRVRGLAARQRRSDLVSNNPGARRVLREARRRHDRPRRRVPRHDDRRCSGCIAAALRRLRRPAAARRGGGRPRRAACWRPRRRRIAWLAGHCAAPRSSARRCCWSSAACRSAPGVGAPSATSRRRPGRVPRRCARAASPPLWLVAAVLLALVGVLPRWAVGRVVAGARVVRGRRATSARVSGCPTGCSRPRRSATCRSGRRSRCAGRRCSCSPLAAVALVAVGAPACAAATCPAEPLAAGTARRAPASAPCGRPRGSDLRGRWSHDRTRWPCASYRRVASWVTDG